MRNRWHTSIRPVVALLAVALVAPGCGKKKEDASKPEESGMAAAAKPPELPPEEKAKRERARLINERMFLRTEGQRYFGVGMDIAEVRAQNVAEALGVKPRQALDLLLGKPILKDDGEVVKVPAVPADKVVAQPTPEQLRAEMKRIKALPEAERLAAVAGFGAQFKLTVGPVITAIYGLEAGQKAEDNPAAVAEMKRVLEMPDGEKKDLANVDLAKAGGYTARQLIDIIGVIKKAR